jgi:hypothetical protein
VSYKVHIPSRIKKDIASWNLPVKLQVEVYRHLTFELAKDLDKHLQEVIVPLAMRAYNSVLTDDDGEQYWFMFAIEPMNYSKGKDLYVVGCRGTNFDPVEDAKNAPP